ncbi:WD-repeat protein [Nostoc carneum NIES-2107]|nr:WD-repeat protein [Nostoc carneum NIES-2107]
MIDSQQPDDSHEYNESSLQMLARAIERSQNFSLIFARCNYARLRERTLQQLREQCPVKIREISLKDSIKTLYTTIKNELGNEKPAAVMVYGFESVSSLDRVLTPTNLVREEFPKNFPFLLVLWINDEVLKNLVQFAPDFESWGISCEFTMATDELVALLQEYSDSIFSNALAAGDRFMPNSLILASYYRQELDFAQKDLQIRHQKLEPPLEASLQFLRGRDEYANDKIDAAVALYQESLNFWQETNNLKRQGLLLFYIGLCYCRKADLQRSESRHYWQEARDYLQQCLYRFEQAQMSDLVAKFIVQLGKVLQRLEAWEDLENLARQATPLHETCGSLVDIAQDYGFLAEVALQKYRNSGSIDSVKEAEKLARQALKILEQVPESQQYQGLYLLLLAQAQRDLNQPQDAIANLEKARESSIPQSDPLIFIRILSELRSLYYDCKHYLKAFKIKQEQGAIEQKHGFRAFIGASRLQPQEQGAHQPEPIFGRQQDVERLINERISSPDKKITVIHGQSGVGKSSIIDAGLIPVLKEKNIGSRKALPILVRVYRDWLGTVGQALTEALKEIRDIELPTAPNSLAEIQEQLQENNNRNLLTIFIFDQFEEFFFVNTQVSERQQFYTFLKDCLNSVDIGFVRVILSLREDYIHNLLEYERFLKLDKTSNDILSEKHRYYIGNFSPDDAKSVIQSLTERSQFYLEPALVDELVQELAIETGEVRPIELQVVGAQLQAEGITTLDQYQEPGTRAKLVQRYLDEVIEDCGSENERAAQLALFSLTDEKILRPLKTKVELQADVELQDEQLSLVLEILEGSGLVFRIPEVPADRYQLVHDYLATLIRQSYQPESRELQLTRKELKEALYKAEIAEIEALNSLSQSLILSHDQLGALVASVKAGRKLKHSTAPSDVQTRTLSRLWDVAYKVQEYARFEENSRGVNNICFSPDGQTLALASADHTVKLWHLSSTEIKTFQGHSGWVTSVCFSPDGQMLASASGDGTVKLWHLSSTEIKTFQGHSGWVTSVCFSPDGQMLASASGDGTVKLWHLDGTQRQTFEGHTDSVNSVCFSPDGQMLASASGDGTVKLWHLDGTQRQTFEGHTDSVNSVCFSPDGQMLASASGDGTVKLWHLDGTQRQTFEGHTDSVNSVCFSPDGQMLASASGDHRIKLWHLDGTQRQTFESHTDWITSVCFSPDGQTLASAGNDCTVRLWHLDYIKPQTFQGHTNSVNSVCFSPDGQMLASAGGDGTVKLWHLDGTQRQTFESHTDWITSVCFSPDGQILASAGNDTVRLWHLDGTQIQTLQGHSGLVYCVCFSSNGQTIASASANRTVKLWTFDGKELQTFRGHKGRVWSICFSPDGQTLASASADGSVRLWTLDGTQLRTLWGHSGLVYCVCFSPDGQTLASASADGSVKLWTLDGTQLRTLWGHRSSVNSVCFSPDGQMIASASDDYTVKLWRLDGTQIQTFEGHSSEVNSVCFSPDGQTLVSASTDCMVILWKFNLDDLLVHACNWLRNYLKNNPNVGESDRYLCDGIDTQTKTVDEYDKLNGKI